MNVPSLRSLPLHTEAAGTAPPDAFGPFRVLHQIGAGAMGPVFRAYDPDHERLVAIKVFALDLAPERVHQLVAELERLIAAGLTHPTIVSSLATGMSGVTAYLAEDYVVAESLDVAIRGKGALPAADVLRMAVHLGGALDFAAAAHVVHGALHPRDVLLGEGGPRVTGLGIAAALERIGVPAPVRRPYAAPERIAGTAWDRRSDIFALAALLHELLWGRRLTSSGDEAASSLVAIEGGDLVRLQAVFARALAEDAGRRFDTALEFVGALDDAFPGVSLAASQAPMRIATVGDEIDLRLPLDAPLPPAEGRAAPQQSIAGLDVPASDIAPPPIVVPLPPDPPSPLPPSEAFSANIVSGAGPREVNPIGEVDLREIDGQMDEKEAEIGRLDPVELFASEKKRAPETTRAPLLGQTIPRPQRSEAHDLGYSSETPPPAYTAPSLATRARISPLAFALVIGVAVGFAVGYGVGARDRSVTEQQPVAVASPPPVSPSAPSSAAQPTAPPARSAAPAPTPAAKSSLSRPAVQAATPSSEDGSLVVRSTPSGASVFVDGRDYGRTPLTVRNLARGAHRIRVTADGYTAAERRVTLGPSAPVETLTLRLARIATSVPPVAVRGTPSLSTAATSGRALAELTVESRPVGARVFLDDQLVGTTPLSLSQVAAGDHRLRLEHDGYRTWSSSIRVVPNGSNRATASLER